MVSTSSSALNALTHKNIIYRFFKNDKLISQRNEPIENGFRFVLANVPVRGLSEKLQDVIRKKVTSVDVAFQTKWRDSKSKSVLEFEQAFEKWVHMDLKVYTLDNNLHEIRCINLVL